MFSSEKFNHSILLLCSLLTVTLVATSGCALFRKSSTTAPRPVALPAYIKGTTFVYSGGTRETVVTTDHETITWVNQRGEVSSGSPDFTRRRANWKTKNLKGTRTFGPRRDTILSKGTTLWPLRVGNTAGYSETGSWQRTGGPEKFYQSNWTCEVLETGQVSVAAGTFKAWKIVCRRYSASGGGVTSNLRETKTWYYAPEVGHYVLAVSTFDGRKPAKRRELMAVLPQPDGLSAGTKGLMEKSFQQALEFAKRGETISWQEHEMGVSGWIAPTETFRLADGTYCRQYIQDLDFPDHRQSYYGLACRDIKGEWSVPR